MIDPSEEEAEMLELESDVDDLPTDPEAYEVACADWPDEEPEHVELEQVSCDGFDRARVFLPQPERARSHPDLPRVKPIAFRRLIA